MHSRIHPLTAAAAALFLTSAALGQASIIDLGVLGPPGTQITPTAVTPDGLVVVGRAGPLAFRWTATHGIQNLGEIANSDLDYDPKAISDDGRTVVGNGYPFSPYPVAVRWTLDGGAQDLGFIANSGGTPESYADDTSADGSLVIGLTTDGGYVWDEQNGMRILIESPRFVPAFMSHDGSIMVGGTPDGIARWTAIGGLEPLWAGYDYQLVGMNDSGTVVVVNPTSAPPYPRRWTAETGLVPAVPAGVQGIFRAHGTSPDASIIVGEVNGLYAWYWQDNGLNADLNQLLPSLGADLSAWDVLADATAVSADGSVVVGWGYTAGTSDIHGWLARLRPSCGTADYNHDGDTGTDQDIMDFFACLAGDCCPTCYTNDFNGDGDVGTDADIKAFFRILAGQPC